MITKNLYKKTIQHSHQCISFALIFLIKLALCDEDPCLEYQEDTNHCKSCADGYTYALINSTTTLCALMEDEANCILSDSYYLQDPSFMSTFELVQGYSLEYNYCFNCTTYFILPSGENLCYSGCPKYTSYLYKYKQTDSQSIGCQVCAMQDYQMKTIQSYDFIDLYVKTCAQNVNDLACDYSEFYDTDLEECVACNDRYPLCEACSQDECYFHNYLYQIGLDLYNYTTQTFNIEKHILWFCNYGYSNSQFDKQCIKSTISNCVNGYFLDDEIEVCGTCDAGYILTEDYMCEPKDEYTGRTQYFVTSGAQYNTTDDISYYFTNSGQSPSEPYYFIASAMQSIFSRSLYEDKINATIYLGKGDHFFFYCNELSGSLFNANGIIQYCEEYYEQLHQYPVSNDNIYLYFKPLYCSGDYDLNSYFENSDFLQICIDKSTMKNPTVYVNQAYSYFQIYGFAQFENINFSGINQLVKPVIVSNDMSTLPILYCSLLSEPSIGAQHLDLDKNINDDFQIKYKCINSNYTGSTIPNTSDSGSTCRRNQNSYYYPDQESTLTSAGEPSYYYYFYDPEYFSEAPVVPRRRNTLFNLYAFPEYMTTYKQPPQLTIVNCTFQYFLTNYESLINVETNDFQYIRLSNDSIFLKENIENYDFLSYNGGERGAKIRVESSNFSHSSFDKGLIVYRKQPYISDDYDTYGNFTYYMMHEPFVEDEGSYIELLNSSFINLNSGFANISALAIYGGKDVLRDIYSNNSIVQQYQAFIHKGIVLNIEDFGGYVEIVGCTFKANMHFIPQIYNSNSSSSKSRSISSFMDNSQTNEYKMSVCNQETKTDLYFLSDGVNQDDDLDSYYDLFERLSTIYISRNREKVIIKNNTFTENVGTFGGAISINSQNWQAGNSPYILIYDNVFSKNMAYFSGNAIYIRNTLKDQGIGQICGGATIKNNNFTHNIGMKFHNGGAVSASCEYVTSQLYQDYVASSGYSQPEDKNDFMNTMIDIIDPIDSSIYTIFKHAFNIENCNFNENYAGGKGSALYIRKISNVRISNCEFNQNGPVLSYFETLYSPYYKYFSQRTVTYYDETETCTNEFEYLANCQTSGSSIDWAHIQGALYVEHCQSASCLLNDASMNLLLENSIFANNQIGYILDSNFPQNLSSQLFISGGLNNTINNCSFDNSYGIYSDLVEDSSEQLHNFFPDEYFQLQQGSLIYIDMNPSTDSDVIYLTKFKNCSFSNNTHIQTLGLSSEVYYYGSLLQYYSPIANPDSQFLPKLDIINSKFIDNAFIGLQTQLVYLQNVLLTVNNSFFTNNGFLQSYEQSIEGYEEYFDSSEIISSSGYFSFGNYYYYKSQDYGIFYFEGTQLFQNGNYHQIVNNIFKYTFSDKSTIIHVNIGNQFLLLQNNTYSYNFAENGGIIGCDGSVYSNLISQSNSDSEEVINSTLMAIGESFLNQISHQGVFSLYLDLDDTELILNFILDDCSFTNTFQNEDSGILSLASMGKVVIDDCIFQIISSSDTIQDDFNTEFVEYYHSLDYFINQTTIFNDQDVTYFTSSEVIQATFVQNWNDLIYFGNEEIEINEDYLEYMEVIDCSFENFYSTTNGVVISAFESYILIQNDAESNRRIYNNSVKTQGIIYASNSTIIGYNLNIENSVSQNSSSVFYLTDYSTLQIYNSSFINNTAYTQGLAYITGSSSFLCDQCIFQQNTVDEDSSIFYADNNPEGYIIVNNSLIANSTSKSNLMNLITTPTLIQNTMLVDNLSQLVNHGITVTNSLIQLINVTISYTSYDFINNNDFSVDICFFNLNFQTTLMIYSSVIMNCRGGTAGVLYATGYSSIYIDQNTIFENNLSSIDGSGGVLYFLTTQNVEIQNTQFINNGIVDIYIQRANVTIINSTFIQGTQQFIYASTSSLAIYNSTFQNGRDQSILGKALYCYCIELSIENSIFQNLSSLKGGAIYLTSQSLKSSFSISDNKFISNQAQFGGALYIQDAVKLSISKNQFISNSAKVINPPTEESSILLQKGLGGSIYSACSNKALYLESNCSVQISNYNIFQNNYAQNDGGAIIWVSNQYEDDGSNIFQNNSASYGSDVASYPKYMKVTFISNNDYYDPTEANSQRRDLETSTTFTKLVSGIPFSFIIVLYDQLGNIYSTDSESIATLKDNNQRQNLLLSGNEIKAKHGVFNFSSVTVITSPGSSFDLSIEVTGMTDYGNDIDFISNQVVLSLQFRNCVSGEEMLNYACIQCTQGNYLYDAPTNQTSCKPCNANSICEGSNIVYPKASYWRSSNTSETWVECPREESCLEGNSSNPTGICDVGYKGMACAQCIDNYTSDSNFKCSICPDQSKNIIKIAFVSLIVLLIVIFLVSSTFSSTGKSKSQYSVYLKLMTNHLQIINALSNINFEWPTYILAVFNSMIKVSSVSQEMFSFDCFLMIQPQSFQNVMSIYFQKLMVYAFLPFILALGDILFWLVYCTIKRNFKDIGAKFISTLVIILFLVHPTITQQMFMAFNCVKINDTYYLKDNIQYECYTGTHLKFLLIIVIPSIVIWSFGIPLFALILLLKNKKIILKEGQTEELTELELEQLQHVKMKYGFLFTGYKSKQYYYEIIILYRKVLLIMSTVILSVVSPEMQALLSILIIVFSMIYQNEMKPFQTKTLNRMETLSLVIATTTMYSGMYFITGTHYLYASNQAMQWILLLALLVPNAVFFLYWFYNMGIELLKMAYKRGKTAYMIATFGCGDYKNFGKKYQLQQNNSIPVHDQSVHQNDANNNKRSSRIKGAQQRGSSDRDLIGRDKPKHHKQKKNISPTQFDEIREVNLRNNSKKKHNVKTINESNLNTSSINSSNDKINKNSHAQQVQDQFCFTNPDTSKKHPDQKGPDNPLSQAHSANRKKSKVSKPKEKFQPNRKRDSTKKLKQRWQNTDSEY